MPFLNANLEEGFVILLVGMLIVFSALVLLFAFFSLMPKILGLFTKKPTVKQPNKTANTTTNNSYVSGEQMAAASAAVYLFLEEAHDQENAIVTINSVAKNYSPWSSKIYVTHQFNNRLK